MYYNVSMDFVYCVITTTTDDKNIANDIAQTLISERLVACVQSYVVQSQYRWQGEVADESEILLQMKTKSCLYGVIKEKIKSLHNYDIPEIVMVPIMDANKEYLHWIDEEVIQCDLSIW